MKLRNKSFQMLTFVLIFGLLLAGCEPSTTTVQMTIDYKHTNPKVEPTSEPAAEAAAQPMAEPTAAPQPEPTAAPVAEAAAAPAAGPADPITAATMQACANMPATTVQVTIAHTNDIYEIGSVAGGTLGGTPRLSTLRKLLLVGNPNTILTFAGDLYFPSGMGNAVVDGTPLDGEQAVDALNQVGIDYMTFGDHEIDFIAQEEFDARMAETQFPIVSSNVFGPDGEPFAGVIKNDVREFSNANGDVMKLGVFGVTKAIRQGDVQFSWTDPITATIDQVAELRDNVDVLLAITHMKIRDDKKYAERFPEIDIVVGGDEHESMAVPGPEGVATVYKADSNARSAYIIEICYDTASQELTTVARLQPLDNTIAEDPALVETVEKWKGIAFAALGADGTMEPARVVSTTPVDLDAFMTTIRNGPSHFTKLVLDAILHASLADTELAINYSWNLRLDDLIPAGYPVIEYDVIRTLPIQNPNVRTALMPGSRLKEMFDRNDKEAGSGYFLLYSENVQRAADGSWIINGEPLEASRMYQVGTVDSTFDDPCRCPWPDDSPILADGIDFRQALINELAANSQ